MYRYNYIDIAVYTFALSIYIYILPECSPTKDLMNCLRISSDTGAQRVPWVSPCVQMPSTKLL